MAVAARSLPASALCSPAIYCSRDHSEAKSAWNAASEVLWKASMTSATFTGSPTGAGSGVLGAALGRDENKGY